MSPRAASSCRTRLTAGRVAPTIAAKSDWDNPSREQRCPRPCVILGQPQQQLGQSATEIEENEVTGLLGEPADQSARANATPLPVRGVAPHQVQQGGPAQHHHRVGSTATTAAERGDPSSRASSPTDSCEPNVTSTTSSPFAELRPP